MQLALPLRSRARAIVVIAMALALVLGSLAAPARAGDDHDDLEAARAAALEKVDYKINSLKEYRSQAKTDAAWAIYSEGIEELGGIRERIAGEDNVYEINVLKDRIHGIWAETKEAAARADAEANDDEGDDGDKDGDRGDKQDDDDGDKEDDEADRRREEEEKRRREQAKAEAALKEARAHTVSEIEKKVRLLKAASQSAHHDQVSDIYRWAAAAVRELLPVARKAESIDELEGITAQMREIIHEAKKEIAAYRPGHDKDGDGEDDGDNGELRDKRRYRAHDEDEGSEDGNGEESTDGDEEQATGEEDDGAEEQQTILAGLNAMEIDVDNYQIAILNTMHPESGIGTPEGMTALNAGHALLDAISAAQGLTGDDLALAWADIMDMHSAYMQLVMDYDRVWGVGLFSNEVVPV
jgi:hypothetical protein